MIRTREFKEIPLGDLVTLTGQAGALEDSQGIEELAESIKLYGLLEPIVVCPSKHPGKYEIVSGQRRFRAHKRLNKPTIVALVLAEPVNEATLKAISVTESKPRQPLTRQDLIDACIALYHKCGNSIKAVADETGLSSRVVSRYVKFEHLDPKLKKLVRDGRVDLRVAIRARVIAAGAGPIRRQRAARVARGTRCV